MQYDILLYVSNTHTYHTNLYMAEAGEAVKQYSSLEQLNS